MLSCFILVVHANMGGLESSFCELGHQTLKELPALGPYQVVVDLDLIRAKEKVIVSYPIIPLD